MATIDETLAQFSVTFAGVEENQKQVDAAGTGVETTSSNIDQVRAFAEELANQSQMMGFEDKVAVTHTAIGKCNEARSQFNAARQSLSSVLSELNGATNTLREAEQIVQSLKSLTATSPPARAGPIEAQRPSPDFQDLPPRSELSTTSYASPPVPSTTGSKRPRRIHSDYPWGPHTLSEERLDHVVNGKPPNQGGHFHTSKRPDKTLFPPSWDKETIREALILTADDPEFVELKTRRNRVWYAQRWVYNVLVIAVVHDDFRISAGWPREGTGVRRNPKN